MPLSLQDRLELLRGLTREKVSILGKLVAIKAISVALSRTIAFFPHHRLGPEPLESGLSFTYKDLYDYLRNLVDLCSRDELV